MWGIIIIIIIIIIIPLFTLASIYSSFASGAEHMSETNNSNIIKHNWVKNPKWLKANQLAIYTQNLVNVFSPINLSIAW